MPSERLQRQIDRLLDQAEEAVEALDWPKTVEVANAVLGVDPENTDAHGFIRMAENAQGKAVSAANGSGGESSEDRASTATSDSLDQPTSFASGRYTVSKILGEGGKKKVYLAHDNTLDRDVAFASIKTEGLDETSRERVRREAQAMGRMGTHPSIMPIYDLGEEVLPGASGTQPYMVQPVMVGGDVEGLIEDADGPLELDRAIEITTQTAQGLSFAHGRGIVHRDLKPGNVWLDEDGSAKIGDFGLAVATDRSRLTVEKVMVGTVSYMPPEQATGGEVTPQADLYSLGAMLYEMCTGRVPFMGDDDIGIISQHVNTPPVAPSWHNDQIPKTLDSLILRLLAKDPAERPSDADEVLAALDAVDLTAVEEREEESKGSLDAMAGGVFVGRHREMDQLKSIFEDVLSGKGRMVTLVGEPGIGKTRTAQELATYAGMRGAGVLWGRSYESGGAPPYWPWVQAIRSHVAATEPDDLRRQLGATAPVIAQLVSDVETKLPDIPAPPTTEDPESARFRLFDSISTFLKQISSVTPLVLMLEDLHWSDKPSLMLLEFVARELANSRILIVGNYRDMELNRRHPLSVTLGDLTRERLFERVVLRGLQRHDVERFIEIAAGISPPPALVDTVHSQTEGNPLFVTETVRLLIQEGDISSGQSAKGGTTSWEIRIPEGVREVIGRRLDRLSERCNEVLTIAAVIGRQFRFDVLKMLAEDTTEGQLLDALDEALSARLIEELPEELGLYQFTHAQMQETLTSELSANRIVRMHARIAEALESHYGDEAEEHAAELAEHYAEADIILGSEKLCMYAATAGRSALASLAHDDAIRFLELAISASSHSDPLSVARLRTDAAIAHAALRNIETALSHIDTAFKYFAGAGLGEDAARTATIYFSSALGADGMRPYLEQTMDLVDESSQLRPIVMAALGRLLSMYSDDYARGKLLIEGALDMARGRSDARAEMHILSEGSLAATWNMDFEYGFNAAMQALKLIDEIDDPLAMSQNYRSIAMRQSQMGNIDSALRYFDEAIESARRSGDRQRLATNMQMNARDHLARGEWSASEDLSEQALGILPEDTRVLSQTMLISAMRGEYTELDFWRTKLLESTESEWGQGHTLLNVALYTGRREDLEAWKSSNSTTPDDPHRSLGTRAQIKLRDALEVIVVGDETRVPAAIEGLDGIPDIASHVPYWPDYYATRGMLHHLVHELDEAVDALERSISHWRVQKRLPGLAMCAAELAVALIDRNAAGDREKAIELQDEAISIATELGMKPLLERVLAKREILKA